MKFWIFFFVMLGALSVIGLSWLTTCTLLYLIALCFGWEFNLAAATGVWLIIILLRSIFKPSKSSKHSKK